MARSTSSICDNAGSARVVDRKVIEGRLQAGTFFKGGAKWLTAEELAAGGMDKLFKKLPEARELLQKP